MIFCKELDKTFNSKDELFLGIRNNKNLLYTQKKAQTKEADSCIFNCSLSNKQISNKSEGSTEDVKVIKVSSSINTIGILDSHGDVHLQGIWNKSVNEQKNLLLIKEHKMSFENVISDKVKASVQIKTWKELGYDADGTTEVLVFDSEIEKDRNEYMFTQYRKGRVKEHSVGMRYVKYLLAMDSDSEYDQEEKEIWDNYIDKIINREDAEERGYFWAVKEAKIIEGSAVVRGSNPITPTLLVEDKNIEAVINTSNKQQKPSTEDTFDLINYIKNKNF